MSHGDKDQEEPFSCFNNDVEAVPSGELTRPIQQKTFHQAIECPFCVYSSMNYDELQFHIQNIHANDLNSPLESTCVAEYNDQYFCSVCNQCFSDHEIEAHAHFHANDSVENKASTSKMKEECNVYHPINYNEDLDEKNDLNVDEILAQQLEQEDIEVLYDSCLREEKPDNQKLQILQGYLANNSSGNFLSQALKLMEKDVGRHRLTPSEYFDKKFALLESLETGIDDGSTCIPLFSNIILDHLQVNADTSYSNVWWMITPNVSHFGSGYGDSGWGCGYRNVQMILSSLSPLSIYKDILSYMKDEMPSVPKLQTMIEKAWEYGFDPEGRGQLDGKVVGTRKWIGATEVFSLFSSLGLHCRIADFHDYTDLEKRQHPTMFEWIKNYFLSTSHQPLEKTIISADRSILYLQHQGHSRSVVGMQCQYDKVTHLIVFDPSHKKQQMEAAMNESEWQIPTNCFKPLTSFKESQYQVVAVVGLASSDRYEMQKNINFVCEKIP